MTEMVWRVNGSTSQTPQNPHGSALSPQAREGPLGPGVWWSTAELYHNPLEVKEKQNKCPSGQITFLLCNPDPHLN